MKLIFRKELFLQDTKNVSLDQDLLQMALNSWVTECDGREVLDLSMEGYAIHKDWCEIVEE